MRNFSSIEGFQVLDNNNQVETGPLKFGNCFSGIYIRGQDTDSLVEILTQALSDSEKLRDTNWGERHADWRKVYESELEQLKKFFRSCFDPDPVKSNYLNKKE